MVPPPLPSIFSPLLFSTTWCVYDPSIHCRCSTSSFLPSHIRGAIPDINSYAFHEHTTTHTVYSSPPFRLLSHLSIFISSHRHWFSYTQFPAFYKLIPIFLSRHIFLTSFTFSSNFLILYPTPFLVIQRSCPGACYPAFILY